MSLDKHTLKQETFAYDISPIYPLGYKLQAEEKKKKGDSISIQKNDVNGWYVMLDVNEYGKIEMIGEKTIGRLAGSGNESKIRLTVSSTENRAPLLKIVGFDKYNPDFVEVDDRLDRTTESFKSENENHKREFVASSVVTPSEFFNEVIPDFEELLKHKTLDEYVAKISDSASKVEKPYTRTYVKLEK